MDYYYNKYLKYKRKYLELKGGYKKGENITNIGIWENNYYKPFGLYGLYGHITKTDENDKTKNILNEREKYKKFVKDNTDPRLPNNEINYIHDLPIYEDNDIVFEDNIIIKHLLEHCKLGKYYSGIKSFEFVPYEKNIETDEEEKKISEFIKDTYFAKDMLTNNNIETDWLTINKYKRRRYRGLDLQQSEEYVKKFSEQAYKIFKKKNYLTTNKSLNDQRRTELLNQKERTCKNLHKHYKNFSDGKTYIPLVLENELIENEKKQYLLSDFSLGVKYANNPKLSKDAYISATSKLGKSGYNIMINKATIGCVANYNDMLFPIRIILDMNPNIMFYENIYERIYLRFIDHLNKYFSNNELDTLLLIINNNKKITINTNNEDIINDIKTLDTILSIIKNKENINNNILKKYIRKYINKSSKKEFNFTISNLKISDILTLLYPDTNDDKVVESFINLVNILIIKRYNNLEELSIFLLNIFKYYNHNNNILKQSIINLFNYIFMIFFNNNYQYVGFWLLRFKNNYEEFENIDDELKYLYDPTNSKPHNSREQYYIFFVFRDNQFKKMGIFFATYPNVNFRNNKIDVSSVVELKKILYHEILQLLCLYYRKQIYFYIILKKKIYDELNCNLQNQYLNDKIKYSKCSKAWLSKESEKIMKDNNFDIENNEIHVLEIGRAHV